jgi:hypothetical protein
VKSDTTRTPPRELGSVYTPQAIAAGMVRACLERWHCRESNRDEHATAGHAHEGPCRILDPACGDGVFLMAVFDELASQKQSLASREDCLQIVRDQIFGVDIDPAAIAALRSRLLERISLPRELAAEAVLALEQNIHCGDSLMGPDFSRPRQHQPGLWADDLRPARDFISWPERFPAAANAGGFDIIVGNPPYLRERNAKVLFDRLAASELGRRWRDARMDLWYYFLHRSLDLLRPGGVLEFIVNSYWMSSRGARRLIERLERETVFEEIQLLNDAPVFKSVAGRHMIFRLCKHDGAGKGTPDQPDQSQGLCLVTPSIASTAGRYSISQADLFQNGRLVVAPPAADQLIIAGVSPLDHLFQTRQGIAENPPCISRRLCREFPGRYELGAGVFVLTPDETDALDLLVAERELLRPYYETQAIRRYWVSERPTHQILYLTRRTAPRLDPFPTIEAHLERFRSILERRREVALGRCAWWHLHWPRDEDIFVQPKVFSVQMGKRPQFAFCRQPAFVGFSINMLLPQARSGCSLEALTGILNSDLALAWFERHAKRRGVNLEINAHVVRQLPLPSRDERIEARIAGLVLARQAAIDPSQQSQLEQEIESLVRELYTETKREI